MSINIISKKNPANFLEIRARQLALISRVDISYLKNKFRDDQKWEVSRSEGQFRLPESANNRTSLNDLK